jgi:hypothetical protein
MRISIRHITVHTYAHTIPTIRPFPFRHTLHKICNHKNMNMAKERSKPWMLKAQETMQDGHEFKLERSIMTTEGCEREREAVVGSNEAAVVAVVDGNEEPVAPVGSGGLTADGQGEQSHGVQHSKKSPPGRSQEQVLLDNRRMLKPTLPFVVLVRPSSTLTVPAPTTREETSTHSHASLPSNDSKPPQTSTQKNRPWPTPSLTISHLHSLGL